MLRLFVLFIFSWPVSAAFVRPAVAQEEPPGELSQLEIQSPQAGQALQGSVPITAILPGEGIQAVEVSFSYSGDSRETWFLIAEIREPAGSGELTTWDTTTLTDGDYSLRLEVLMVGKEQVSIIVPGLRIRNYTPIETTTPTPAAAVELEAPPENTAGTRSPEDVLGDSPTASPEAFSSQAGLQADSMPEPRPANPAQVTTQAIVTSLGKGALGAGVAFLLLGVYRGVLQVVRNRRDAR